MNFNDGLPTGPSYVLGISDPDEDNVPTRVRQFPELKSTDIETDNLSGWPFYDSKPAKQRSSNLSMSVTSPTLNSVTTVSYDDLVAEDEAEIGIKPDHSKPKPEIQYDNHPEYPDHIKIDNLVDIPEEELARIRETTGILSDEIAQLLLDEGAAGLLAFDSASSYVEAALNDGLGIGGKVDATIPAALANILRLSVICRYMERTSIPDKYKNIFLANLSRVLSNDAFDEMKKKETAEKRSSVLKAAALQGRVVRDRKQAQTQPVTEQPEEPQHTIGVGRGVSGLRVRQKFSD